MAFTYSKLAEVTVGSGGATTVDFTGIPQNYNDLVIYFSGRGSMAGDARTGVLLTFNGMSGSGYSGKELRGFDSNSTGSLSSSTSSIDMMRVPSVQSTASTFSNISFYVPNYTSSNNKSVSIDSVGQENNSSTSWYIGLAAGLWSNTGPISRVTITSETGNFVQHSTATLYGVKAEV